MPDAPSTPAATDSVAAFERARAEILRQKRVQGVVFATVFLACLTAAVVVGQFNLFTLIEGLPRTTEYIEKLDYAIDPQKNRAFAAAAGRYLAAMRPEWLSPDYAGIRPKLSAEGEPFRDFEVNEESDAGLPGFVNLIGIESPGLTASLALGDRVVELLASF